MQIFYINNYGILSLLVCVSLDWMLVAMEVLLSHCGRDKRERRRGGDRAFHGGKRHLSPLLPSCSFSQFAFDRARPTGKQIGPNYIHLCFIPMHIT